MSNQALFDAVDDTRMVPQGTYTNNYHADGVNALPPQHTTNALYNNSASSANGNAISPDSSSGAITSPDSPVRALNASAITGAHPPSITVEVYENQRWFPITKWTSSKRLPLDRPHYSSKSGADELSMETYRLPPGYAWGSPPISPTKQILAGAGGGGGASDSDDRGGAPLSFPAATHSSKKNPSADEDADRHANTSGPFRLTDVIANKWQLEVKEGRTDAEGWRYAVDYKAHFKAEMHHSSLVRRRRFYRTAVYTGVVSPMRGGRSDSDDAGAGASNASPSVFSSGGVGAISKCGEGFVLVSKTDKGNIVAQSGGNSFAAASAGGGGGAASSTTTTTGAAAGSSNAPSNTSKPNPTASAVSAEERKRQEEAAAAAAERAKYTSDEAQRQAAIATLASMKRKEAMEAEAKKGYLPKDNQCAAAADNGGEFALPTSFDAGGKGSHHNPGGASNNGSPAPSVTMRASANNYATFESRGSSETAAKSALLADLHRNDSMNQYGFTVPDGPMMAMAGGGSAAEEHHHHNDHSMNGGGENPLLFASQSGRFVVPSPERAPRIVAADDDHHDGVDGRRLSMAPPPAHVGSSSGAPAVDFGASPEPSFAIGSGGFGAVSSPPPAYHDQHDDDGGGRSGEGGLLATDTSAGQFDAVFSAFVAKEKSN